MPPLAILAIILLYGGILLFQVLGGILMPSWTVQFARYPGYGAAFRIGEIVRRVGRGGWDYAVLLICLLAAVFAGYVGMLACIVGVFFTFPYAYLACAFLIGQFGREELLGSRYE